MENSETIKILIEGWLSFSENIISEIKNIEKEYNDLTTLIISKDKKGEPCLEDIARQRALTAYSFLLNDELTKVTYKIAGVYKTFISIGYELKFDDKNTTKLDNILQTDISVFEEESGKIVSKNKELLNMIIKRVNDHKEITNEYFLNKLRETDEYTRGE